MHRDGRMNTAMAFSGALAQVCACACALFVAGCSSEPGSTELGSSGLQAREMHPAEMRLIRLERRHDADAGCQEDAGQPADFTSCQTDGDCVAVPLGGCCYNGWKTAVNRDEVDAYADATACDQPRTICPEYIVRDTRVPVCDVAKHQCEMQQVSP